MRKQTLQPKFKVAAITEDEATNEFSAIIKYRNVDGAVRSVSLPLADLDNRKALVERLKNRGAHFSSKQQANNRALAKLMASKRKAKRLNFAARVGWRDSRRVFILPNRVIGANGFGVRVRPPLKHGHTGRIGRRGEQKKWMRTVARPAQFSSRMVLGISVALGAPLLKFANLPSFGILNHGPGKAGKSTMLVAAGSVSGYGSEKHLPNFRATDVAFGEIPAAFNDSLLPMNELGLLKGSAAEKRQRLRDLAYGFAEGRGTTYSQLAPIAEASRGGAEWSSIVLATGEETSNEIARDARECRMAGEAIRWIDLAATRDGAADIFDRMPTNVREADRAKWAEQLCAMIRAGCRRNHGTAIQQFIEQVIENRNTVQKRIKVLGKTFVSRVTDENDDPVVLHLAKCFGHIYAAGVLGVRFGTLPWSVSTVRKCIERCYRDARRELNTETDLLREGLRIMHEKIRALPKANGVGLQFKHGFQKHTKTLQAIILPEEFKHWFPDPRQPSLVLKFQRAKNALPSRPVPKSGLGIVWAETQPTWPDGSRRRSIVIEQRKGQFTV